MPAANMEEENGKVAPAASVLQQVSLSSVPQHAQTPKLRGTHSIPASAKGKTVPMPLLEQNLRRSSQKPKKVALFPGLIATPIKTRTEAAAKVTPQACFS
jgi:hypothetical protein